MARVICISDTHLRQRFAVPDGDILIHAGDGTFRGTVEEVQRFNDWFSGLPHAVKIFVAGNHDWLFQTRPRLARSILDSSIIYLQDTEVSIEGLRIYGSPWTPEFMNWAFMLDEDGLAQVWERTPGGLDLLVTHGPPLGILDANVAGQPCGSEALRQRVQEVKPRFHLFGHIHEGYGQEMSGATRFVNASICDENYQAVNAPVVLEIEAGPSE